MMRRFLLTVGLVLCMAQGATAQHRHTVIAVNYPLQFLAIELLGKEAEVVFPVPADVDPSFWRPAIADISLIQGADLILLNGAGFATWVDRVSLPRAKVVNTTAAVEDQFIVTESITHSHGDGGEHSHEGLANYTWLDLQLAIAQAEAMADAMTARGLGDATVIADRLALLTASLDALDKETAAALAGMEGRTVLATHPRYDYFARRYGLNISALEWEAGAMPSTGDLTALEALIADTQAEILIWEATPPPEAFAATAALGVTNVVFPPLAHAPSDRDFIEAYGAAVEELAAAAAE